MADILFNKSFRDGSSVYIRREADGRVIGTIVGVSVNPNRALPLTAFTSDLSDVPREILYVTLLERFSTARATAQAPK